MADAVLKQWNRQPMRLNVNEKEDKIVYLVESLVASVQMERILSYILFHKLDWFGLS